MLIIYDDGKKCVLSSIPDDGDHTTGLRGYWFTSAVSKADRWTGVPNGPGRHSDFWDGGRGALHTYPFRKLKPTP